MNTTIDFSFLKRLPISFDIENAQKELELLIPKIIDENITFFETNNYPKRIDYIIAPVIKTENGLLQLPYPELLFTDRWLSKEIMQKVSIKFYDLLFKIINKS